MADGFESARSEAYFYGGMKDRPAPRRIRRIEKDEAPCTEKHEGQDEKTPPRNG